VNFPSGGGAAITIDCAAERRARGFPDATLTMVETRTHYEHLRVAPEATPEEIRESYRRLSARYHPDRHPRHPEAAARIMAVINVAYEVLSDPSRRARYDRSIGLPGARGRGPAAGHAPSGARRAPHEGVRAWQAETEARRRRQVVRRLAAGSLAFVALAFAGIVWLSGASAPGWGWQQGGAALGPLGIPGDGAHAGSDGRIERHVRPLDAPDGSPWPAFTAELTGPARRYADGDARLVLDNRLGDSDVYAKLLRVTGDGPVAARHMYVRARDRGLLADVRPGSYEVRYLVLDTGFAARSAPFELPGGEPSDAGQPAALRLDSVEVVRGRFVPITREEFMLPMPAAGRR
jgi:hypothetical protein